jgi:hypothetical protein
MPEWGFEYAPNGRRIEEWSFTVPAYTTLLLLLASAAVASVKKWRELRGWEIVGLWIYHFGCAAAFMVVYALLWIHAARSSSNGARRDRRIDERVHIATMRHVEKVTGIRYDDVGLRAPKRNDAIVAARRAA